MDLTMNIGALDMSFIKCNNKQVVYEAIENINNSLKEFDGNNELQDWLRNNRAAQILTD
jgi:hypothetical protein